LFSFLWLKEKMIDNNKYFFGEVMNEKGLTLPFKVFAKDHPEFVSEEQLKKYIVNNFKFEKMTVKFISSRTY